MSAAAPASRPVVAALETTRVTRALHPDLVVRGPRATHDVSSFVLVRVITGDGVEGYGEVSATPNWSGEDAVTAEHVIRDVLAPALAGRELTPVPGCTAVMDRAIAGHPFTKAGVNTALWDALGRTWGLRVADLLGGALRDRVAIKISLSGDGDELDAAHAAAARMGFTAFKLKVGRDPGRDAARFAHVRELVGRDAFLGADANGAWTRMQATRLVPALRDLGAAFVEQPLAADDVDGLAGLRRLGVPVVADESVYSLGDLARVVRADAADAVSIYVGKSGALERAVAAARVCAAFGLGVVIGSNGEMGVGAAAQTHVACACEALGDIPSDINGPHLYPGDLLEAPLPLTVTEARLPEGAGLGVTPAEDIRRRFS